MKAIDGIIPGDDEEFLSCLYPVKIGRSNCVNGDTIVSHFAFYTQREYLDKKNILDRYGTFLHKHWLKSSRMKEIDKTIQNIMSDIASREQELLAQPSPYGKDVEKKSFKQKIKGFIYDMLPNLLYKQRMQNRIDKDSYKFFC